MFENILLVEPTRYILLWIIKTLHLIQSITLLIGPYITSNVLLLSCLVMGYMLLMTFWYLYGHCICTPIEQYLDGSSETYEDGNVKSFIGVYMQKIFGNEKVMFYFITFMPVINTMVALTKIVKLGNYENLQFSLINAASGVSP